MIDVTQTLQQIESRDPSAADDLLPLVYDEGLSQWACIAFDGD